MMHAKSSKTCAVSSCHHQPSAIARANRMADDTPTKPETPPARKRSGQFRAVRVELEKGRKDAGLDEEPPDTDPEPVTVDTGWQEVT
jgi:hypothetical protein